MNKFDGGISIDLEEYFHASNLKPYLQDNLPSRLEISTNKTLEILANNNTKATFFILGELAESHSHLLREISKLGHEIASHSFYHDSIFTLTPEDFEQQAYRSKAILEDTCQTKVIGFRAPNFSITNSTPWALPILAKLGYEYDSSLFPIYHPRYSNPDSPRLPHYTETDFGKILRVPLTTYPLTIFNHQINLPLAGGAYWRLLPKKIITAGLKKINSPIFTYFHPWELDPEQEVLIKKYSLTRWRHYGNLKKFPAILNHYLSTFRLNNYKDILDLENDNS